MTTYNKISEQIQRLVARSIQREDLMPAIDKREVRLLVNQVANSLLAVESKQATRIGDMSIPSCSIATYPAQPVTIVTPVFTLTSGGTTTFNLTGAATTSGSTTITYASNTTLKQGDSVTHANIPAGTVVNYIVSSTSAVLSAAATATGTGLTLICWTKTITYANNIRVSLGDTISGTGIPANTTVQQLLSTTSCVLSNNATAASSGTFTVTPSQVTEMSSYTFTLPAIPVKLPFDIGVWGVYVEPYMIPLIPVTSAQMDVLTGLDEALLENQVGYLIEGRKGRLIGSYAMLQQYFPSGTPTVSIKELIVDVGLLADDDPFPVPPEQEFQIVQEVARLILAVPKAPENQKG